MVTFLANICTVLTERNIKRNTKEIKCRCPAWVNGPLYFKIIWKKIIIYYSLFNFSLKEWCTGSRKTRKNSRIERERELMALLLNEGRLKNKFLKWLFIIFLYTTVLRFILLHFNEREGVVELKYILGWLKCVDIIELSFLFLFPILWNIIIP